MSIEICGIGMWVGLIRALPRLASYPGPFSCAIRAYARIAHEKGPGYEAIPRLAQPYLCDKHNPSYITIISYHVHQITAQLVQVLWISSPTHLYLVVCRCSY